jgi:WD repeat-containing protein 19
MMHCHAMCDMQARGEMDLFTDVVTSSAAPSDFERIAQYYESRGELTKAADMWGQCNQKSERAIQLYLQVRSHNVGLC